MVALLKNSTQQKRNKLTAVKAYILESTCGRGASIIMNCCSKALGRVQQAPRRAAVKLNIFTLRKGACKLFGISVCGPHDSLQRTQMHTRAQKVSLTCLPRRSCSASLQSKIVTRGRPPSVPNWHGWTCVANGDEISTC